MPYVVGAPSRIFMSLLTNGGHEGLQARVSSAEAVLKEREYDCDKTKVSEREREREREREEKRERQRERELTERGLFIERTTPQAPTKPNTRKPARLAIV